jgi:hypothetical protein
MLQPPPEDHSDKISEQPMPPLPSSEPASPSEETHLAENAPQGDELFYYVLGCLQNGSSKAEVRKQLIAFGYASTEAEETVEAVGDWRRKNPDHQNIANTAGAVGGGNASMWIGGIICLVGLVVTIGSCLLAGEGGGRYYIAWGAIVFGGIQFFRGLSQSNQN